MRALDFTAVVLIGVMMLGPLALAPAYGPYVEPGMAAEVTEATAPLQEGSSDETNETNSEATLEAEVPPQ